MALQAGIDVLISVVSATNSASSRLRHLLTFARHRAVSARIPDFHGRVVLIFLPFRYMDAPEPPGLGPGAIRGLPQTGRPDDASVFRIDGDVCGCDLLNTVGLPFDST